MKFLRIGLVIAAGIAMVGCGQSDYNTKQQSAIVEQSLPPSIAGAPEQLKLPKWGVRNPHVHVEMNHGKVEIYSDDHGWNGHTVNIYYVPSANVEYYNGDYALHSTYSLQRVATAPIKNNGTWRAVWDTKGHDMPDVFYILARTNVGQVTLEEVNWNAGNPIDVSHGSTSH